MRRSIAVILFIMILLTSCALPGKPQVYQTVYLDVFDTVTTIRGYARSEKSFRKTAEEIHAELLFYHRLFDGYHTYPDTVSIKTLNDTAAISPVAADPELIALLEDCKSYYDLTEGRINAAMGSVLLLWHAAREAGLADPARSFLPDPGALQEASLHCRMKDLIIDSAKGTIRFADPELKLDVGAIAKGWTAQRICTSLPEGYLLNLGGNVCVSGAKPDGSAWIIGIQSPDAEEKNIATVPLTQGSAVTSGDYQRCYRVDGKSYHHIIDPDTLMPSEYWRSVTVLCSDSGLADCLSTALFLMPLEQGKSLAARCGAEAMWVSSNGDILTTDGF